MFGLEAMFGSDAVLKLDATSTTRAGLEKLFFSDLTEIPPLVFMEEAEKADPEALKIWLGALDDRGEIRKINFRVNMLRQVKVLFICSVNNKALFDKMMGSDGNEAVLCPAGVCLRCTSPARRKPFSSRFLTRKSGRRAVATSGSLRPFSWRAN